MAVARRRAVLSVAGLWLAVAGGAGLPACSVLYDLEADQCAVDADCAAIDAALTECRAGLCVAPQLPSAGASGAGAGASGGMMGGEGGEPAASECASNAECMDAHFGQPYLCKQGQCIDLATDACPLVIGTENLRAAQPIIFGAYAVAPDAVSRSIVSRNLDLAVSEFTTKVTGLRGGPNGSRRTLAFVVCNSYFPNVTPGTIDPFEPSLEHLLETVEVPGMIAALQGKDLQAIFAQRLDAAGTFVISPYEQDSELASLSDAGRLWHMLGATSDIAPVFGPLLERTETFLRRDESFLKLPSPGAPLRVAVVTANVARENDVRDALLGLPELDQFDVEPFQVESALLTSHPDVASLTNDLLDYAPHIIVALAGSEFIQGAFPGLEDGSTWSTRTGGQKRPMYLLGSAMAPETWSLYSGRQGDAGGWKTFFDRIVGVAYASADDTKLLDEYEFRLKAATNDLPDTTVVLGSESVYDAAYLLIYAAAGAGEVPALRGKDLARGMLRLVDGSPYDIGPSPISKVLTALDNAEDIGLNLTLGEPRWNVARGTRTGVGSVYCLNNGATDFESDFPKGPQRDALRYDPETNTLEAVPLPCIPNF